MYFLFVDSIHVKYSAFIVLFPCAVTLWLHTYKRINTGGLNARAVVNLQHQSPPGLHSAKWEKNGWYNATVLTNTIELTGCVSGRPCSMAGSSILFLGSTCALGETLGGLWEREEGGKSEAVYGCT